MKTFVISFNFSQTVINLELMLTICNCENVQLVRVYVNKIKKKIKMYVELLQNEKILYDTIKTYSIYKCDVSKESEERLLTELKQNNDISVFEMKYRYDIYNMYMLKKICD